MSETAAAVKEKPILFSGAMIRAVLDGRKTQTRREVSERARIGYPHHEIESADFNGFKTASLEFSLKCPFGKPGDRLWVREVHRHDDYCDVLLCRDRDCIIYAADYPEVFAEAGDTVKWKPSIHMPRWASRITLEITNVRVERLQEISEDDALHEGCVVESSTADEEKILGPGHWTAKFQFIMLWESINGKDSWNKNPWVWVVSFRRI